MHDVQGTTGFGPTVSVVLAVRNGVPELEQQVRALRQQTYPEPWELVIADNGSTDGTVACALNVAGDLAVRIADASARAGAPFALNTGVALSRGQLLVFCDHDDVVAADWLERIVRALEHTDLVAGGLETEELNDPLATRTAGWKSLGANQEVHLGFLPIGATANLGMTRVAFEAIGGFDERFKIAYDVDLCWRAQLAGFTIGYARDAVVHYRLPASLRTLYRKNRGYGWGDAHLYATYRKYGVPSQPLARALKEWAWLISRIPLAATTPELRRHLARRFGYRTGRLIGSLETRTPFL
jgi:glycosyltransferase involved in cell wall biosynthesis